MMEVPYYSQKTLFSCGAASAKMILKYYGISKNEKELIKNLKTSINGTEYPSLCKYFTSLGFKCQIYKNLQINEGINMIKEYLKKKVPLLVTVDRFIYDKKTPRIDAKVQWESDDFSGHIVVLTKITNDYIYFNDPHELVGKTKLPLNDFIKAWHNKFYKGYLVAIER